jgi:hypothetical protein
MEPKPKPVMLTFEMPKKLHVASFRSTGPRNKTAFNHHREFPLPWGIAKSSDYKPARMHVLSSELVGTTHDGWSFDGNWEWSDAPYRARSRIFQTLLSKHLRKEQKVRLGNQWILEDPIEVKSSDGRNSTIWICADFQYVEVGEKNGIAIEITRKVQSSKSIWEEMGEGIYGLNQINQDVRVKVRDATEKGKMRSMKLVKITNEDLNTPAWDGSEMTIAQYWNQGEEVYTPEASSSIPVILLNRFKGDSPSRYPADQVYRVMSMENWPSEVRNHLSQYLNLSAEKYLMLVQKAMKWMRGWSIDSERMDISFSWHDEFNVQHSDSRDHLFLPNGNRFLTNNWRWSHNVRNFENLHGRPPPSVDAHFVVPEGGENHFSELTKHANSIFDQIPEWKDRVVHHDLRIIPTHSKAQADFVIQNMIDEISKEHRSVVVFSALPPKQDKGEVDLYKSLKYALDEANMIHQNFSIQTKFGLKKKADSAAAQVNVLQMLLKHGFLPVPYSCSVGDVDVVCALDVGRIGPNESVTAFAVSITKTGQLWGTTPKGEPQTGETISEDAIRRTIKGIIHRNKSENNELPSRILMMRDGNTPRKELKSVKKIVSEYAEMGIDICWISVRKSGVPRLLNFIDDKVVNELPLKGHWMAYDTNSAWMWTTGAPELKQARPGIPQGSSFTIECDFSDNPLSIELTAKLLICHAHASQMQPWNSTRLPFVHHLSDKMAKSMANGEIPLDQNGNRFSAA